MPRTETGKRLLHILDDPFGGRGYDEVRFHERRVATIDAIEAEAVAAALDALAAEVAGMPQQHVQYPPIDGPWTVVVTRAAVLAAIEKARGPELCPDCGHEVEAHIGGSCRYVYNSDLREQCECSWVPHHHLFTMLSSPPTCEVCGAKAGEAR